MKFDNLRYRIGKTVVALFLLTAAFFGPKIFSFFMPMGCVGIVLLLYAWFADNE